MTSRTIVYVSWPAAEQTGGIKTAFRHVEALRAAGFDSFVGVPVHVVHNHVDTSVFRPRAEKRLQIACMPSKRPVEAAVVQDLFRAENPQWAGVPWIVIQGLPELEVARVLGESAVVLSLCRHEAFPPDAP